MSARLGLGRSRAFEVARRSFSLPDLTALEPVAKVTDPVERQIATTYFDTADLRLAARDTSVRCSGSRWVLRMLSDDGEVVEVETNAASESVPADVNELILGSVRDKRVEPVATVRTARVERRLLDIDGRELACILDDIVDGQRFTTGGIELTHWRQVTVELTGGDGDLLDLVVATLGPMTELPSGQEPLHRALGWSPGPVVDLRGDDRDASAMGVLRDRLRAEVRALVDQDWAVRTGRPDAVRDMRLAALRLRCDLATWKPYLDETSTEPIRHELRWLVGVLGRVHDAEMLDGRLLGAIDGLPPDMVVGPVRSRVGNALAERTATASARMHAALDDGRYFALLDRLEVLAAGPPFTARADGPADELLVARLSHALGRLDRALAAIDVPGSAEARTDQLRAVAKAARRAGYAAEALEPRFERRARRLADRMRAIQDPLGDHRDSVVARQALSEIGAVAHLAGESAFSYGILHGIERDRGDEAVRAFEAARRSLGTTKVHRWLADAAEPG